MSVDVELPPASDSERSAIAVAEQILQDAVQAGASDVHLQAIARGVVVRFRVDGFLEDRTVLSERMGRRVVNSFKVLGNLDVADARRPHDGRMQYHVDEHPVDLRLSTVPSLYGENLAIRVLDRHRQKLGLAELGLDEYELASIRRLIDQPYGLILSAGPTGAGKTTSLYAMLEQLDAKGRNIITVEEPIEYDLDRVNQIAVDRNMGLDFAHCLRAAFRQDPDVLLIGEIRDAETADIAVRAALSGHLVMSSVHASSTFGAFSTLVQHGVSPFLLASGLVGVVAQQLVRRICPSCYDELELRGDFLGAIERRDMEAAFGSIDRPRLATGHGCGACRGTGYQGRTGVFEVLDITPRLREAFAARASRRRLEEVATSVGWRSLQRAGFDRVVRGVTTLEEVLRVVPRYVEPDVAPDIAVPSRGHEFTPDNAAH